MNTVANNPRPIYIIAQDIRKEWNKPYFGAVPYIQAMSCLFKASDYFNFDDGRSIINYFLANAQTFKGDKARELKNELKEHLKM